jgi:hypothetical protein
MIVKEPPRALNKHHILYISALSTVESSQDTYDALMIAGVVAM